MKLDEFKRALLRYLQDAMPGGALNPEVTPQGTMDAAALALSPVPIVGDVVGLAADANRYRTNPEERTPGNFALTGLGALPFVPSMGAIKALPKYGGKEYEQILRGYIDTLPRTDRGVEYGGKVYRASGNETHIDAVMRAVKELGGEDKINVDKLRTGIILPDGKFITHEQHQTGKYGAFRDNTDGISRSFAERELEKALEKANKENKGDLLLEILQRNGIK